MHFLQECYRYLKKTIRIKLNFMVRNKILVTLRSALVWFITQPVVISFCTDFWGNILVLSSGFFLGGGRYLTPEGRTDRMSHNVSKKLHYSLRNNPEKRSSQFLRDGSLKSHIFLTLTATLGKKSSYIADLQPCNLVCENREFHFEGKYRQ